MPISRISGLEYQILHKGTFAMLQVGLKCRETLQAESGAMVSMSSTIEMGAHTDSFFNGQMRRMAGECRLFQRFQARDNGVIFLSPRLPGDIAVLELDGSEEYKLSTGAYLASTTGFRIEGTPIQTGVQLIGRALTGSLLNITGRGTLFVSSYGAISCIELSQGEEFIVDNGHVVAMPAFMSFDIEQASQKKGMKGIAASVFSGEGMVYHFYGPGKIYFQSRNSNSHKDFIRSCL